MVQQADGVNKQINKQTNKQTNKQINKLIHRPEEVLDIQSELIFVNGMVHFPQE